MGETRRSVVLLSIDALKPEFILEQERMGIRLPNFRQLFLEQGACAENGMVSVLPTLTYPAHQSMVTGVNPARHGIYNNAMFDPMGEHLGAWNWFVNRKVKTLWEAAEEAGYQAASAFFPGSAGAKGSFMIPEFWWDGSMLDSAFIDVMSKPQGLVREFERELGPCPSGLDLSADGDRKRFQIARWLLENKLFPKLKEKPFFFSLYLSSFDETVHQFGVYSQESKDILVRLDEQIGSLIRMVAEATGGHVVFCLTSDHGAMDCEYTVYPNVRLRKAGLIHIDEYGSLVDWRAWMQRSGGSAEIRLKDPGDEEAAKLLKHVIEQLTTDPKSGILKALTPQEAAARGGFPEAAYVLLAMKGCEIREEAQGSYRSEEPYQKAQHGFSEIYEEMMASFFLTGEGVPAGSRFETVRLIDVAPTLAAVMGAGLPDAEGKNLLTEE